MGGGDGPGELDRVALKELEKGIVAILCVLFCYVSPSLCT